MIHVEEFRSTNVQLVASQTEQTHMAESGCAKVKTAIMFVTCRCIWRGCCWPEKSMDSIRWWPENSLTVVRAVFWVAGMRILSVLWDSWIKGGSYWALDIMFRKKDTWWNMCFYTKKLVPRARKINTILFTIFIWLYDIVCNHNNSSLFALFLTVNYF